MKPKLLLALALVLSSSFFGCSTADRDTVATYVVKVVEMKSKIPIAGLDVTMIFPSVTEKSQTDKYGIARFDVKGEPVEATVRVIGTPFYDTKEVYLAHPLPHQIEIQMK